MTFWILSFKMFSQLDWLDWISHRFTRLHTNRYAHVQASVCAWLWGVADPSCHWLSRLISSHGHQSSIIHEIDAETLPGPIWKDLSPSRLFPSALPPQHFSLKIILPHTHHSAEFKLSELWTWKVSVHLEGWQRMIRGVQTCATHPTVPESCPLVTNLLLCAL